MRKKTRQSGTTSSQNYPEHSDELKKAFANIGDAFDKVIACEEAKRQEAFFALNELQKRIDALEKKIDAFESHITDFGKDLAPIRDSIKKSNEEKEILTGTAKADIEVKNFKEIAGLVAAIETSISNATKKQESSPEFQKFADGIITQITDLLETWEIREFPDESSREKLVGQKLTKDLRNFVKAVGVVDTGNKDLDGCIAEVANRGFQRNVGNGQYKSLKPATVKLYKYITPKESVPAQSNEKENSESDKN